MNYKTIVFEELNVVVRIATFEGEYYVSAEITTEASTSAEHQHNSIEKAILKAQEKFFKNTTLVWKRLFVSDIINQKEFLKNDVWSIVQQAPLNRSKVSAIAYFVDEKNSKADFLPSGDIILTRPNYTHLFSGRMFSKEANTAEQTTDIFNNYIKKLAEHKLSLQGNTIRTWIYVKDVDSRYADMVSARNKIFDKVGLTADTHSIASTGIEGRYFYPQAFVLIDAYSANVSKEQISFLKAETHLNSTHEYGVSFERGTAVDYADRRHIFISGTASINNKGEIVAVNNIEKQIERTIENIGELLKEGKATMQDVSHFIIYLRDSGDYALVEKYFADNYPDTPHVIVHAPVCRPGWLIEIECIAITPQSVVNNFREF
ncbi:MAG: hypothetical protein LBR45_02670 [Bacteroidales bacterium]|jgi:enamine deaminase RidA (YjgF/YER057c/UK114 family)|nr:hypothetical protein [Bacteroidales bacterium]